MQATLPVKHGGLGIRKATDIALPAYFSSLAASVDLANRILGMENLRVDTSMDLEAKSQWEAKSRNTEMPAEATSQQAWDREITNQTYLNLVEGSESVMDLARLKAATGNCSGAWLEAIPIPCLGTRLEDEAVRIAVSLRLGCQICVPHTCLCSSAVDSNGLHGLDCQRSSGRWARHAELNTIVHRSLASIGRPSVLEPVGMTREDGRRPDGMTLFPWHSGKPLVWVSRVCPPSQAPTCKDPS